VFPGIPRFNPSSPLTPYIPLKPYVFSQIPTPPPAVSSRAKSQRNLGAILDHNFVGGQGWRIESQKRILAKKKKKNKKKKKKRFSSRKPEKKKRGTATGKKKTQSVNSSCQQGLDPKTVGDRSPARG